jgi:putative ABC transport system permease protein
MRFDLESWNEIWQVLSRNKLRTALTAFGVFWGLFMLIIMLGSGRGLQNGASKDFGTFATNSMFVWTQRTSKAYKGFGEGRFFELNNDDVEILKQRIPEINIIAPRCQLGGYRSSNVVQRKNNTGNFGVMGDVPELLQINPKRIVEGRFINQTDLDQRRKSAVIGQRVKEVLFDSDEDALGAYIEINGVYFLVVGVFGNIDEATASESDLETIYVPISTFQRVFNYGDRVGWLSINSKPGERISELEPKVFDVLAERHQIHPDDKRAFGSWNMEKRFLQMENLFLGINFLIWIVGSGTLLAGVIGVSNIMLVVVKERTREIGIRKALGATPNAIISQVMLEALVLTSVSGYLGLAAATFALEGINSWVGEGSKGSMFAHPEINFMVAVWALVILVLSGLFAGWIPARRAASIQPVEAFRE